MSVYLMSSPNQRRDRATNDGLLESPPPITATSTPSPLDDAFKHLNDAINGESGGGGAVAGYISGEGLWPVTTLSSSEHEQEILELRSNVRQLKQLKERIKSREEHTLHSEGRAVALMKELQLVKLELEEQEVLQMENRRLKTAIQEKEVRAASHELTFAHLRNENQSLDTIIEGLRLEVEKHKLENTQLTSNKNFVIDKLKAEIEMYRQETQSKIEPLKIMLHESRDVGTTQETWAEAGEKEEGLSSLRGLLKEARGAVEKTRTAFEETAGPQIAQLTKLREEKQCLLDKIRELKRQNESFLSERACFEQQFDDLKSEVSEKGTNIKCLTAENEKLKASASRLAQKRIFSPTAASAAAGGRANCQENVEKLKIELRKAKSQVEASDKAVIRLEQQLAQMKNNGREEELNNANATISKLRKTLERERREREHFSTARAALLDKLGAEKDDALIRTR